MRRNRGRWFPPAPTCVGAPTVEDAKREQQASSSRFMEAAHQGPEVRRVSSGMRDLRIRNGFEELIETAMERRKAAQ